MKNYYAVEVFITQRFLVPADCREDAITEALWLRAPGKLGEVNIVELSEQDKQTISRVPGYEMVNVARQRKEIAE